MHIKNTYIATTPRISSLRKNLTDTKKDEKDDLDGREIRQKVDVTDTQREIKRADPEQSLCPSQLLLFSEMDKSAINQ